MWYIGKKDNKVVSVMTNFDKIEPVASTEPFNRRLKKRIELPLPPVNKPYNMDMGDNPLLMSVTTSVETLHALCGD